ncbi:site-specific DNA-methyltransferase [Candidatus Saccharibacteria bacterium]|nr:site-specific DNA-methyltransferase [Candidatus Saccharibacteria bacterium]
MANVSKQHRDELLEKISKIREFIATSKADKNTRNLLQYLNEITKDIKGKKYGLVFEEHREAIDEKLDTHIPVLVEERKLAIDNGGEQNFLIEGDNLAALKLLEKTHKGKIDVIYIDPPYNTENSLTYDDTRVGIDDEFRHSKWLSFMYERLSLAKKVLAKEGVIMVSIDDNEAYQLKILMDEIFTENNCMGIFAVIKAEGGGMAKYLVKGHDLLLVYARDISKVKPLAKDKDIRGKRIIINDVEYWIQEDAIRETFGQYGNLYYEDIIEKRGKEFKKQIDEGIKNNEYILVPKEKGKTIIGKLRRVDSDYSKFYSVIKHLNADGVETLATMGLENYFDYPKPVSLLKEIIKGATFFKNKSIILDFFAGSGTTAQAVLELNKEDSKKRSFILCTNNEVSARQKLSFIQSHGKLNDYEPNKQTTENAIEKKIYAEFDNGKEDFEKFVKKNFKEYDSLGICKFVTYPRIKNILKGYKSKISEEKVLYDKKITKNNYLKTNDFNEEILSIIEKEKLSKDAWQIKLSNDCRLQLTKKTKANAMYDACPGSLKYFRIDYVPISDKLYYEYADELLLHIRELVELENGINFSNNTEIAIILTDSEMEQFVEENKKKKSIDIKKIYRGHNVLLLSSQAAFLKKHNIKINVIPDYYYQELAK